MTPALEQIKALPAKWRKDAMGAQGNFALALNECADQLDTALQALRDEAGEAVLWQSRHRHSQERPWSDWEESDQESYEAWVADPQVTWEFRALYTRPAPAAEAAPQGGVSWQELNSVLERARKSLGAAGGTGIAGAANSEIENTIGNALIDWIADEIGAATPPSAPAVDEAMVERALDARLGPNTRVRDMLQHPDQHQRDSKWPPTIIRAALESALAAGALPQVETWRPIDTAPRDGTMLRLLVAFTEHATEDSPDPSPTIGANNFDGDGEDEWRFAGWCWTHDHFTEGKGTPVGWLPMLSGSETLQDAVPMPRELTKEMLSLALSHLYGAPFWRADAKPIGAFYSGHTATESEMANIAECGPDRVKAAYAAMIAARPTPAAEAAPQGGVDWQERCLELGFKYWRAPDAHGVECTQEQALGLLRDLLGVEVDFVDAATPPSAPAVRTVRAIPSLAYHDTGRVSMSEADFERLRIAAAEGEAAPRAGVDEAVNRFLAWPLPKDFMPDGGVSFTPPAHQVFGGPHWPVGTNLLTAVQAKVMFEHCLAAGALAAAPAQVSAAEQLSAAGAPSAQKPLDGEANKAGVAPGSRNSPPSESVTRGSLPPPNQTPAEAAPRAGVEWPPFIRDLLHRTEHCLSAADEGVDYAVSREMLDAMTTLGLMKKVGRGKWAPTDAAERFVQAGNAALAAYALPQGMVRVPREPTEAMRAAVRGWTETVLVAEDDHREYPVSEDTFAEAYRAMLAAAPAQAGEGVGNG